MFNVLYRRGVIGIEFHEERRDFKVDARFYLVGERTQRTSRVVSTMVLRGVADHVLHPLESVMELDSLDSLWR